METTFRFREALPGNTRVEIEFEAAGGASFPDGGAAHRAQTLQSLERLKAVVERSIGDVEPAAVIQGGLPNKAAILSKGFYLSSVAIANGLVFALGLLSAARGVDAAMAIFWAALWGLYAAVVMLVLFHKMWASIQDGYARTTPGKAVGFFFIPIFNIYWAFQAIWGFAKDYNNYLKRHQLNAKRLPEGLFLAFTILSFTGWMPVLGVILVTINYFLALFMVAKICDAVNSLGPALAQAVLRPALASERGDSFLGPLSLEEKIAVGNLPPLDYMSIINKKKAGPVITVITDNPEDQRRMRLLEKLEAADLERLAESVQLVMKADRAAVSNISEAARLYRKAAEVNPYNDLALMSYGCALARQGNLQEGIKWVEKALQVNPKNERASRNLASMKGDRAKAA
jgi:hypothetical protein